VYRGDDLDSRVPTGEIRAFIRKALQLAQMFERG